MKIEGRKMGGEGLCAFAKEGEQVGLLQREAAQPLPNRAKRLERGAFPRFRTSQTIRKRNAPHSRRFATSGGAQNSFATCEQGGLLQRRDRAERMFSAFFASLRLRPLSVH